MSEAQAAPASAPNAAAVKQDGSPSAPPNQAPEAVTAAIEALNKKLDYFIAEGRKQAKAAPAVSPQASKDDEAEQVSKAALKRELDELKRARERDKLEARQQRATAAYKDELVRNGVNVLQAEDLADIWASKNVEKIKLGSDGSVHLDDEAGGLQPITSLIKTWLGTPKGMTYLPAKPGTGDAVGLQSSNGQGNGASGVHPFAQKSYKEIMDSQRSDLRSSYIRNHREDFERKKREHRASN